MRLGAFLLGGILGAAAVMYVTRNRTFSMAGFSNQMNSENDNSNQFNDKAKNVWNGVSQTAQSAVQSVVGKSASAGGKQTSNANSSASAQTAQTAQKTANADGKAADGKAGLEQVEQWIDKDPKLRVQVSEILAHQANETANQTHA